MFDNDKNIFKVYEIWIKNNICSMLDLYNYHS